MKPVPHPHAGRLVSILEEVPPDTPAFILEYAYIAMVLRRNNGNRTWTARETGLSLKSIRTKIEEMKLYGFDAPPPVCGGRRNG
jgi:DNA-binding NtrC family response regulator